MGWKIKVIKNLTHLKDMKIWVANFPAFVREEPRSPTETKFDLWKGDIFFVDDLKKDARKEIFVLGKGKGYLRPNSLTPNEDEDSPRVIEV